MSSIVSSIVGGVNEQNSIVNTVCVDNWTAELSTIASNVTDAQSINSLTNT